MALRRFAAGLLCAAACNGNPASTGTPRHAPAPSPPQAASGPEAAPRAAGVPDPLPRPKQPDPASAATPAPPPYDLAADLDERLDAARKQLGERIDSEVIEGVFLIVAPGPKGALRGARDVTRRALAAYFNDRFTTRPTRAITVLLFPNAAPYEAYCKARWERACISIYGFYLASERAIVMNVGPGIGTLTHELVHPLVEADFPGAPEWLNEGIASLYERFHLPKAGEIRGSKNWRHPRLLSALGSPKERDLATLPKLFSLTDAEFRGEREDLNYALARYFCQWLDQQNLLWPFYQRYRDTVADDPSGRAAFEAVTGKTPEDANGAFSRWVRGL